MTGKQLQNLRLYLEGEDNQNSGNYRWDFLDGYDGDDKGSLEGHPELQEKVRRVVTQGYIDPEDFNGVGPHKCLRIRAIETLLFTDFTAIGSRDERTGVYWSPHI